MNSVINVEFTARTNGHEYKEEGVAFRSPSELFEFVSPGGGCERIPDEVEEIQMVFLPPTKPYTDNPMEAVPVTVELGMVFITGPLAEIVMILQLLIGKASRGQLSQSFLKIIGVKEPTLSL